MIANVGSDLIEILRRLRSGDDTQICQAAHELFREGIRRHGRAPRGTPSSAAVEELAKGDLAVLHAAQERSRGDSRCWLIAAMSQWGGAGEARTIREVLERAEDDRLREFCVESLETLGGRDALGGLVWALICVDDQLAISASSCLYELAIGGTLDLTAPTLRTSADFAQDLRMLVPWDRIRCVQQGRPPEAQKAGWDRYLQMLEDYLPSHLWLAGGAHRCPPSWEGIEQVHRRISAAQLPQAVQRIQEGGVRASPFPPFRLPDVVAA